jgi:MinD-like ATPase involved in chromosome partitioning or flagellar assembly
VRTVSFYSYKGGTGRTLLVANLAVYAARLGQTVVMVDLDLEAPGLAYKFLPSPPFKPGVLEWLSAQPRPSIADMSEQLPVPHPFNANGALWLIGAGPPPSKSYLREVRQLQSTVFADDSSRAVAGMLELRDTIADYFDPDLLLLDARTGISNTNAITTRVLAEDVVALTLKTDEQLEGTRAVLRSLAPLKKPGGSAKPLGLHVVISRVTEPEWGVDDAQRSRRDTAIADDVRRYLTTPADPLTETLTLVEQPLLLRNDAALAAEEHLLLAAQTNQNPTRALHFDYLAVAERLLGPEIIGPAVAEAFRNIDDVERMERADFFGDSARLVEAKAPTVTAEIRPDLSGNRAELRKKVDLLRRSAKNDPRRRPDLAEAFVQLAWATFDARTSGKSNGLSFLRDAERIYRDLAKEHPNAYLPAHIDSLIQYSAMAAQLAQNYDALTTAAEAVDLATEPANRETVPEYLTAKALTNLAAIRYGNADPGSAADPIRKATRLVDELERMRTEPDNRRDLQVLRAAAHNQRALVESALGETSSALSSANTAVETYRQISDADDAVNAGLARALNNLANIHRARVEYEAAVASAQQATEILRNLAADQPQNYLEPLATAMQTLSASYADAGDHQQALILAEHAAHLWRDLTEVTVGHPTTVGLVGALNNVAARHGDLGRYDDARAAGEEAVSLGGGVDAQLRQKDESDGALRVLEGTLGSAWANLATTYRHLDRLDDALSAARKARDYALRRGGDPSAVADTYLQIATLLLEAGRPQEAYDAARQVIDRRSATDDPVAVVGLATAHLLAARAKIDTEPALALELAARAAEHYTAVADLIGRARTLDVMADAYRSLGDVAEAERRRATAAELRNEILTERA